MLGMEFFQQWPWQQQRLLLRGVRVLEDVQLQEEALSVLHLQRHCHCSGCPFSSLWWAGSHGDSVDGFCGCHCRRGLYGKLWIRRHPGKSTVKKFKSVLRLRRGISRKLDKLATDTAINSNNGDLVATVERSVMRYGTACTGIGPAGPYVFECQYCLASTFAHCLCITNST